MPRDCVSARRPPVRRPHWHRRRTPRDRTPCRPAFARGRRGGTMNIFFWHVHGSYATSFVQGPHDYYVPVLPGRGPDGRGRAQTYPWPENVYEVDEAGAAALDVDVLVLQRPHEWELAARWLGRRPGLDVPTVYLEHNTPPNLGAGSRHPFADRADVTIVHVTHCNALFW